MKKLFIIPLLIVTVALAGCQSETTTTPEVQPPVEEKAEKTSTVQIKVAGENGEVPGTENDVKNTTTFINETEVEGASDKEIPLLVPDTKGVVVNEQEIVPDKLVAQHGDTLMLYNESEKQIDLYTTAEGSEECSFLEATIEIPGNQTVEVKLEKTGTCTIIDQLNTDHKLQLTVE